MKSTDNDRKRQKLEALAEQAKAGSKEAVEEILIEIQDMVFNLSLRMLGTIHDAEDASQEILIKVMTHLSGFRGESAFTTWVFSIATNHLLNYKKHLFANAPLSFEFYGEDIVNGKTEDIPDMSGGVDKNLLEEELKMSCTNVMLQCLDGESRCIYILGTMFKADSRIAGEILGMTPEAYRQQLSRIRRKVAEFLKEYCGLAGGRCSCKKRVNYAIATHRINPQRLEYQALSTDGMQARDYMQAMEQVDDCSVVFSELPMYGVTQTTKEMLSGFLNSELCTYIKNA